MVRRGCDGVILPQLIFYSKSERGGNMKTLKRMLAVFLSVVLIVTAAVPVSVSAVTTSESLKSRVIGYLPAYKYEFVDSIDFSAMTHVMLSFIRYKNDSLVCDFNDSQIRTIKEKCDASGTKVLLAVGGGSGFEFTNNPFDTAEERTSFISDLMYYVDTYDLDGIDIDIETVDADVWTYFDLLIAELSAELKADDKLLTMAVSTWFTDPIENSTYEYFDFINLMSYYGQVEGVLMDRINTYISYYSSRGIPDDKMTIGVPFYATDETDYQTIVASNKDASMLNQYDGKFYNGIPAISAKAEFSLDYGGIMIWEVGQDSFEEGCSLVQEIKRVYDKSSNSLVSNLAVSRINCTEATLKWDKSADVVSYNIYNGTELIGTTSGTSFTIKDLTASTEYIFKIAGIDASGNEICYSYRIVTTHIDATDIGVWDANTIYYKGDKAVYEGKVYTANWWTQGNIPPFSAQWSYTGIAGTAEEEPIEFAVTTNIITGDTVTVTCEAVGGTGPYKYTFYAIKEGKVEYKSDVWTGSNTAEITLKEAGAYKIMTYCRDATGKQIGIRDEIVL